MLVFVSGAVLPAMPSHAVALEEGDRGIIEYSDVFGVPIMFFPATPPTDREGRLKEKYSFYSMVSRFKGNSFTFAVPKPDGRELSIQERMELSEYVIKTFWGAMITCETIFTRIPQGYKFNVVFGKTAKGHPFNLVYSKTSRSNIYPDSLPFENGKDLLTLTQKYLLLHEIGHGFFAIAIGNLTHPRNKAIEEGAVDHMIKSRLDLYGEVKRPKVNISREQADNIQGITQLDVEASIWGKEHVVKVEAPKGYSGYTHHLFGIEFIDAYFDIFPSETFPGFLRRLKAVEDNAPKNDFGTIQIKAIFRKMGFSEGAIADFEKDLHRRLKTNVFKF